MASEFLIFSTDKDIQYLLSFYLQRSFHVPVVTIHSVAELNSMTFEKFTHALVDVNDLSADDVENFEKSFPGQKVLFCFKNEILAHSRNTSILEKPFSEKNWNECFAKLSGLEANSSPYSPVPITMLERVSNIRVSLFVKINDHKYLKISQPDTQFNAGTLQHYHKKHVDFLYIETSSSSEFVQEYQKSVFFEMLWSQTSKISGPANIRLNAEVLRDMVNTYGWSEDVTGITLDYISKVIKVSSLTFDLNNLLAQFTKIERFGYADHCILIHLISTQIARQIQVNTPQTLRQLAFASLYHDLYLNDFQYANEAKLIKAIKESNHASTQNHKDVLTHPTRAADFCRRLEYCPALVDTIIMQHHENPTGTGIPLAKRPEELHLLSCIFIVSENFVNYFIQTFGEPDVNFYLQSRKEYYKRKPFSAVFDALAALLTKPAVTQSLEPDAETANSKSQKIAS